MRTLGRPASLWLLAAVIAAACGPATVTPGPPGSPPASSAPAAGTVPATIYLFLADERGEPGLVPVARTVPDSAALAPATLEALLAGPTAEEAGAPGRLTTAIPSGTRALGLVLDGNVATVDLSGEFGSGGGSESMLGRVAQIVYTVTALPDIEAVLFHVDGRPAEALGGEGIVLDGPQTRDAFTEQLPEIFVDTPAWGASVTAPVRVTGLTRVFEATFQAQLFDDRGLALAESVVTATCGTGCWGTFDVELDATIDREQVGSLRVFEASAKDGSPVNVRVYPVTFLP